MAAPERARIEVPASTSNCGPGFDCLGLALSLTARVEFVRRRDAEIRVDGGTVLPGHPLVAAAADLFFRRTGIAPFGFDLGIASEIPPARGLGSSGALRVAVLAGLDGLAGTALGRREIASLGTALEGHPDNACAAVYGGFTIGRTDPGDGRLLDVMRFPVGDEVCFVVASPERELSTKESRGVLPATVSHRDAARSINSVAAIVGAFATQEYARLRHAVSDFLHEPYRIPRLAGAAEAIAAGIAAGAYTGFLSGSGSSVLCVAPRDVAVDVATAMDETWRRLGVAGRCRTLTADNAGYRVLPAD